MTTYCRSLILFLLVLVFSSVGRAAETGRVQTARHENAAMPLRVSNDRRVLLGADGKPFLVVGDTAWSLIAQLTKEEIAQYLDDRKNRGFNAIIVNLIERKFATKAPSTIAGIAPFLKPGDFSQPNPAYLDDAHDAIAAAAERGIAVWFCPAYLGWDGGPEGFYQEIKAAGPSALRTYGRIVGEKFKDLPNIVWMVGGDFAKADYWTGNELIAGIREGGATQIATGHGGNTDATDTFGDAPWLVLDNVYRYVEDLYNPLRVAYGRKPVRPFVLIETYYEGVPKTSPEQIRRQAWWAMLSGACGQFFGNAPIWHLGGPGLPNLQIDPTDSDWKKALSSIGSRDMARLGAFFREQPWPELVPDVMDKLVTDGRGKGATFITAAVTQDSRRAIIYVPSDGVKPRALTLDLSFFAGPVRAAWFNPAQDAALEIAKTPLSNQTGVSLDTPGDNGSGTNDWVLVLTSE